MKILIKILAVIIVVAVIAVVYLANNLGELIKGAVEQYAPPITETSVTLDSASIMPLSGKGSLGGFNIGQPAGFGDGNILALGEVALDIDIASLNTDTIVIRSILIDTPELHFVQTEAGNNLQALASTIERNTASDPRQGSGETTQTSEESGADAEKKIIIDVLTVKSVTVSARLPQLPDRPLELTLPTIEITDIGRKAGGERISDAMRSIAQQLNQAVAQAIANSKELQEQLKQELEAQARKRAEQEVDKKLEEKLGSEGSSQLKQLLKNR